MGRRRGPRPPGPEATVEEQQEWIGRALQRERDHAANGRVTGHDLARNERSEAIADVLGHRAAEIRDRIAREGPDAVAGDPTVRVLNRRPPDDED